MGRLSQDGFMRRLCEAYEDLKLPRKKHGNGREEVESSI